MKEAHCGFIEMNEDAGAGKLFIILIFVLYLRAGGCR